MFLLFFDCQKEWIEHLEFICVVLLHDDELIKMLMSFRGTLTFVSNQIWIQQQQEILFRVYAN